MARTITFVGENFVALEVNTDVPGVTIEKPVISGEKLWVVVVNITTKKVLSKCLMFLVPTCYRKVTLKKVGNNFALLNSFVA